MSHKCPHTSQNIPNVDLTRLKKVGLCADCNSAGPNLWVCLHQGCLNIGCSVDVNDHSTKHFEHDNQHCIQVNLSSQRIWCYLCEHEVFLSLHKTTNVSKEATEASSLSDIFVSSKVQSTAGGLVGLQNLANTCYMNSALQALSNVWPLTYYFLHSGDILENYTHKSTHWSSVGLARSYQRLIEEIWCKQSEERDYIAPRGLLYGMRRIYPMFRGFQQHDTQEFLRCFMDHLHEELKDDKPAGQTLRDIRHSVIKDNQSSEDSDSQSTSESEYESCDSNAEPDLALNQMRFNSPRVKLKQQTSESSIISDIFDGKLISSVQCLTCDRVSTREETFQDLSLPIPDRDYLNVLHQTHNLNVQSMKLSDTMLPRSVDNWLSWLWKAIRFWVWGPSVTLYDCMASFFSADELKGDNMYSCEKCSKLRTGVKYSKILCLPEILCIHLKRFRHDVYYSSKISSHVHFPLDNFDMTPYLHKGCTSQVINYKLVSVICHHGTVGGGHYTCFARNALTNRWYEYDDQHVTEVTADVVQNCQAYVLFYAKYNANMNLIRAEAAEFTPMNLAPRAGIRFYVANEWLLRFNTFAEPGPVNNWDLLCPHGGILKSKVAVPISQPLWDYLYEKFGGGPAINMLFECEVCKHTENALTRRQHYELTVFTKYNELDIDCGAIYAISMQWLRKWQQFARGITNQDPGPINNTSVVSPVVTSCPIRNVRPGSDYAQLNSQLWQFLYGIYGGGPEIILRGSIPEQVVNRDDCDRYGVHHDSVDLSDTEINIEVQLRARTDAAECDFAQNEQSELKSPTNATSATSLRTKLPNIKGIKRRKYPINSRMLKPRTLCTRLRKKVKKNRKTMQNVETIIFRGKPI